ncbi:MAG: hypothetical protein JWL73_3271 [Actinomycetia bacterium]|nr:hypothetical protein [Actinomycetes bacterium]
MRGRLHTLRRARPSDAIEAVVIVTVAARVEWSLRRRGLPATAGGLGLTLLGGPADDEPAGVPDRFALPDWAWRRARIARIVLRRWPFGDTCLRRALVIGNRLATLRPELVIGVRPTTNERGVDAHAWLRIQGVDLDPLASSYLAFGER